MPAPPPAHLSAPQTESLRSRRWDLFCRVIDNLGDVGVCWRLACNLAAAGEQVRLVIDDSSALRWMAPQGHPQVQVLPWPGPAEPGEVCIETFGCDPPPAYVQAMHRPQPPVWLNLEHLSAEAYVERCHGLLSPQADGLRKWFFYPGFSAATGGLLLESGLPAALAGFDRDAWLQRHGIEVGRGVRLVSLFCYSNPALPALLQSLARQPTLLLATSGAAQQQLASLSLPPGLRVQALPWLTQTDFDGLLWACDLNFVRGEDSLVRALWAGRPFVWQAYPQHDGAHLVKLQALLQAAGLGDEVAALWWQWNGRLHPPGGEMALPELAPWREQLLGWREHLWSRPSLTGHLRDFVQSKAAQGQTL